MKKTAVMLYPYFSLQEITCLTACLAVWFGEKLDFIASEKKPYESEDGFQVIPTKTFDEVDSRGYDLLIMPGIINPLPALSDEKNISFLKGCAGSDTLIASISSAPILLCRAGLLDNTKFTAGFFMQMAETFDFVKTENFTHKPVVEDKNIITGIGFAFREFAERVLKRLDYDIGDKFMMPVDKEYTEEELTFYWTDEDYKEFKEELKDYPSLLKSVPKTI